MKRHIYIYILMVGIFALSCIPYASSNEINAADADIFNVPQRGALEIEIDADLSEWILAEDVLVMGEDTWEAYQGGDWDDEGDLTAMLRIAYDTDNLYFALLVKDDEYIAEAANPWENDGIQMAIDSSAGKIAAGWPNTTTHLYNFSIKEGWQMETGPFMGDAEIEMERDDDKKETTFEWRMDAEIIGGKNESFEPGREIAFAIIANDSDEDAKGQKGWVGWGNLTIVFGKNPEEMKTLVLTNEVISVEAAGKLLATWGALK